MNYRRELKYLVSSNDLIILDARLKNIMHIDPDSKCKIYNVKSIYFDSFTNKCFYDNEDGQNERYKIRIRMYNNSLDDIKLEIKYKKNGLNQKESCLIDKKLCQKLMMGKTLEYKECINNVLKKLYIEQKTNLFEPKIIVEYDRIAYVDKVGNVRITFDTDIRSSRYIERFFEKDTYARPILETNKHILEVKYDDMIAEHILKELKMIKLERIAFSKYYLSRLAFKEEVL